MTPILKVLKAGWHTTIQDGGRYGYRHLGVPISGVLDKHSFLYVNHKLGNDQNVPVLEIVGSGASFEVLASTTIFLGGARCIIDLNGNELLATDVIHVVNGDIISIKKILLGVRTYMGVRGGFMAPKIMDSASSIAETALVPLQKNDVLHGFTLAYGADNYQNATLTPLIIDPDANIRCHQGPEYDVLSQKAKILLTKSEYTITTQNNRMGYRISGPKLEKIREYNMLTSAVMPGTVQLLPDGDMIILMRECQTTGGYLRILQITESSLNQLAQRTTNDLVRFDVDGSI